MKTDLGNRLNNGVGSGVIMAGIDLSKMDAMARKMDDAVRAFHKAIESGDANAAGDLLNIIKNTSSFLSEDLYSLIQKAEPQQLPGVTQFVNGVPIAQHQEVTHVFDVHVFHITIDTEFDSDGEFITRFEYCRVGNWKYFDSGIGVSLQKDLLLNFERCNVWCDFI